MFDADERPLGWNPEHACSAVGQLARAFGEAYVEADERGPFAQRCIRYAAWLAEAREVTLLNA